MFAGEQPEFYDRYLVPAIFAPYAAHAAALIAAGAPGRVLELAAGTGAGTRALAAALPNAEIVATDLSADMLARAAARLDDPRVSFTEADAQQLPFEDASFDAAQFLFGIMFVPDRALAFRELRRVLRPGGRLVMTSWDAPGTSAYHAPTDEVIARVFGGAAPPTSDRRTPYRYHDVDVIRAEVGAAFEQVDVRRVELSGRTTAADLALGYTRGSTLFVDALDAGVELDTLVDAMRAKTLEQFGPGEFDLPLSAVVTVAS